jgi:hypothetical protein
MFACLTPRGRATAGQGARLRRSASSLLALLALTASAGCGGSNDATHAGGRAASTAAVHTSSARESPRSASGGDARFVARAEGICSDVLTQLKHSKLAQPTIAELARVTPTHVAIEQRGIRALSKLEPPPALASRWRQMLGYMRTLTSELGALGKAAKAHDEHAITALAASKKRGHSQLRSAAKAGGFHSCQLS